LNWTLHRFGQSGSLVDWQILQAAAVDFLKRVDDGQILTSTLFGQYLCSGTKAEGPARDTSNFHGTKQINAKQNTPQAFLQLLQSPEVRSGTNSFAGAA
jgi:hypothetical protein